MTLLAMFRLEWVEVPSVRPLGCDVTVIAAQPCLSVLVFEIEC